MWKKRERPKAVHPTARVLRRMLAEMVCFTPSVSVSWIPSPMLSRVTTVRLRSRGSGGWQGEDLLT